jgi:hypothetical protein
LTRVQLFLPFVRQKGTEFPLGICVFGNSEEMMLKAPTWHGKSDICCEITSGTPKGGGDLVTKHW